MFEDFFDIEEGWKRDLVVLLITLIPAFIAVAIVITVGSKIYFPVTAVLANYYFAVGIGWITSPVVGLSTGLSPIGILVLMVFVAMESSLVVTVNYDLLEKIPLLGRAVKAVRERAEKVIEKYELAKNIEYMTIFWLMFIPFYGTGPMVMSFVGRILALEWWKVWITISLSAFTRYSLVIGLVYFGFLQL